MRALASAALALCVAVGTACAWRGRYPVDPSVAPLYEPDRRDYAAFREAHPDLIEPNYLPYMTQRFRGENARGDALVFCRWADDEMPLPVYIEVPQIPDALQDEFHPIEPAIYVGRVASALRAWERELEGLVRFQRVERPRDAQLLLRLRGEVAPAPSDQVQVLGTTPSLARACRSLGWSQDGQGMKVRFRVPVLSIFVADRSGMLTPGQVERIALHEIGHALGMTGHSPIPTDFMYRVVRERPNVSGLSSEDVNSFLSLYRIPNGTVFAHVGPEGPPERASPGPPSGRPVLATAPHVDARHGFEIRTPEGWLRVETDRGFFTADGPIWDQDASIEVVVWPNPSIESFLDRFSATLFADTWLRRRVETAVGGRRALQIAVEDAEGLNLEEFTIIELGDGRVMMILTRCPVGVSDAWRVWFQSVIATLEVWQEPGWAR